MLYIKQDYPCFVMYVKYLILHLGDVHVHNNSISLCESKFKFLNLS